MTNAPRRRGRPAKVRPPEDPTRRQEYFDRSRTIRQEMADLRADLASLRATYRDEHGVDTAPIDKAVALSLNDTPAAVERFRATVAAMEEFNVVRFDARGQGNVFAALEPPATRPQEAA